MRGALVGLWSIVGRWGVWGNLCGRVTEWREWLERGIREETICVGCLHKWFRLPWGYGSGGLRDDLWQLRRWWRLGMNFGVEWLIDLCCGVVAGLVGWGFWCWFAGLHRDVLVPSDWALGAGGEGCWANACKPDLEVSGGG